MPMGRRVASTVGLTGPGLLVPARKEHAVRASYSTPSLPSVCNRSGLLSGGLRPQEVFRLPELWTLPNKHSG